MLNIDEDDNNADWAKMSWDLPEYKSEEFMNFLKLIGMTLEEFRQLPVYKYNLAKRTIKE